MAARRLIVFKHATELGNAPSHVLFDAVSVRRADGVQVPRSFGDYAVHLDRAKIPAGIEADERL
jgi:CRISPR-associated protein Csd2